MSTATQRIVMAGSVVVESVFLVFGEGYSDLRKQDMVDRRKRVMDTRDRHSSVQPEGQQRAAGRGLPPQRAPGAVPALSPIPISQPTGPY